MEYLYILQQALVWIITIFWLYNIIISACSLVKLKDKPLLVNKKHKFMALIPAHNEEAVVANLVESLKNQNYPEELFERVVWGMLPKGRLGRAMAKKLFVYKGSEHKHEAQKPEVLTFKKLEGVK